MPCQKKFDCGHQCTRVCGSDCGECDELVEKILPCGHKTNMPCHEVIFVYFYLFFLKNNIKDKKLFNNYSFPKFFIVHLLVMKCLNVVTSVQEIVLLVKNLICLVLNNVNEFKCVIIVVMVHVQKFFFFSFLFSSL